jgi:hypothetical protein
MQNDEPSPSTLSSSGSEYNGMNIHPLTATDSEPIQDSLAGHLDSALFVSILSTTGNVLGQSREVGHDGGPGAHHQAT